MKKSASYLATIITAIMLLSSAAFSGTLSPMQTALEASKWLAKTCFNSSTRTVSGINGLTLFTGTNVYISNLVVTSTATFMAVNISTDRATNIATSSMTASSWHIINGGISDRNSSLYGWNLESYVDGTTVTMRWNSSDPVFFPFVRISLFDGTGSSTYTLSGNGICYRVYTDTTVSRASK